VTAGEGIIGETREALTLVERKVADE